MSTGRHHSPKSKKYIHDQLRATERWPSNSILIKIQMKIPNISLSKSMRLTMCCRMSMKGPGMTTTERKSSWTKIKWARKIFSNTVLDSIFGVTSPPTASKATMTPPQDSTLSTEMSLKRSKLKNPRLTISEKMSLNSSENFKALEIHTPLKKKCWIFTPIGKTSPHTRASSGVRNGIQETPTTDGWSERCRKKTRNKGTAKRKLT